VITMAKSGIATLMLAIVGLQMWVVPEFAAGMARIAPEFSGLRVPGVVLVGMLLFCVQLALACVWRLLALAGQERLFEDRAFPWVDAITVLIASAVMLVLVGSVVIGNAGAGGPFILLLTVMSVIVGGVLALIVGVLRDVLRHAVLLQEQVTAA